MISPVNLTLFAQITAATRLGRWSNISVVSVCTTALVILLGTVKRLLAKAVVDAKHRASVVTNSAGARTASVSAPSSPAAASVQMTPIKLPDTPASSTTGATSPADVTLGVRQENELNEAEDNSGILG